MILALLIAGPATLGLLALLIKNMRVDLGILLAAALSHAVLTSMLWTGAVSTHFGILELDVTGRLFLSVTSALFLAAAFYTVQYILHGTHDAPAAPYRFVPCLLWFLSAMTLVAVTQHLAVMWAAVEGTTLASAPLVYYYRRRSALEATWKYLLLCSVGIALALLGTFLVGIAAAGAGHGTSGLLLSDLIAAAPTMPRAWLKAGFVLALVGYGTKMGLAPMHTWLPDTHSQAPSPVSALLSGALLNCAFLAILRFFQVCLASGDPQFARTLLITLGMISIAVACGFMIAQRDYKRLFAYSSIENMGIMAVGIGLGGAASFGAMLHAVNHSLCKAGLFFLSGNLLRTFGSTLVRDVRGAAKVLPASGVLITALVLAIGGVPPFGPFWSELLIFQTALHSAQPWLGILFLALLTLAFLGMASVVFPMLQGDSTVPSPAIEPRLSVLTPLVMASAVLVLGLYLPPILSDALHQAARLLGG